MSVSWFCPDCSHTYNPQHKYCQECHTLLYYHCLPSHQKGRYDNFIRHTQHCTYCTPTLLDIRNQEKNEFMEDTRYEMSQADQSKLNMQYPQLFRCSYCTCAY
jgi:hypothetical protein